MSTTERIVQRIAAALRAQGAMLATAESCTGGLVAAACTDVAGSSEWFERGFVTYSNAAKVELLGVPATLIEAHGAVSAEVARAMAEGAIAASAARHAVAVTGIAGPGGGSAEKPVGTVWLACSERGGPTDTRLLEARGDRAAIRAQSVSAALGLLLESLEAASTGSAANPT